MPGGNSTARPYNRDEKKASKIIKAARAVNSKINARETSGDLDKAAANRLRQKLRSGKVSEAHRIKGMQDMKQKTRDARKASGLAKGGVVKKKSGGVVKKKSGGTCRGMGAATKGGKYSKA